MNGGLDFRNSDNLELPDNLTVDGSLNFAVNTKDGIMISVGFYFGTLANLEANFGWPFYSYAKAYKTAARECIAELTAMLTAK